MIELLASAARTASGNQEITSIPDLDLVDSAVLLLDVTAAATVAGDTLNLRLQQGFDDALGAIVTWDDFLSFTQVLGNGGAVRHIASFHRNVVPESELRVPSSALAAGVLQGPVTKRWRWNWTIAGATPNFTFRVLAGLVFQRRR